MDNIIVIVGPTGVGKTKLSIELAKKLDAEIINGDSVSIYKELNIGSAKPTIDEREGIPHHLIDIRSVLEDYSVFDYQKDFRKVVEEIQSRGKRVIVVGGTGLYIKAALYDYRFVEQENHHNYDELSNEEILDRLLNYSVEVVDPSNRRRLVNLLNKLENEEEITYYKDQLLYPITVIGLTTSRDILYDRINHRVDQMIDNGLLEEVNSLKDKYSSSRILNSGIGYKEFVDYFNDKKTLEEVIDLIKKDSRHFAKRQYTFFNHQFQVNWFDVDFQSFNKTIEKVYDFIKRH
ncbi:MAG: tRNA (adenosine(37)-N6)-dimethylallyltransferase MiaA [Bacilli bacterium]|nr:tRNA (adenosine(37)-N6)-dimethylallyltransferase MiaA [Bacilli bacterium]